jgi:hypothetical protein
MVAESETGASSLEGVQHVHDLPKGRGKTREQRIASRLLLMLLFGFVSARETLNRLAHHPSSNNPSNPRHTDPFNSACTSTEVHRIDVRRHRNRSGTAYANASAHVRSHADSVDAEWALRRLALIRT